MLDLSNMPTSAVMRLAKAVPRREGAGLSWDVDLCMEVANELDAQAVDAYLPGAASAFAAREGSRGAATTSGGFDMMRATLLGTDGQQLATCHAEVRKVAIKVTASQGVLTVGLRLHGLVQEAAMGVVYQLDEQLQVQLQAHAQQLSLLSAVQQQAPPDLEGRLVVHQLAPDTVVAGIVHSQDGTTLELATLEDPELVVVDLPSRPDSVLEVRAAAGADLHRLLLDYVASCDAARVPASWLDVVQALGERYASGDLHCRPDFAWEVSASVLEQALGVARSRAAGEL